MTWKEKTIVRILLIIAKMLAEDPQTELEIKQLAAHVSVWGGKDATA